VLLAFGRVPRRPPRDREGDFGGSEGGGRAEPGCRGWAQAAMLVTGTPGASQLSDGVSDSPGYCGSAGCVSARAQPARKPQIGAHAREN
jgi:phage-related minor tail protein